MGRLWPYPQILDYARKTCQEQTLSLIRKSVNYGRLQLYSTGPWAEFLATCLRRIHIFE